jgi:hypothetical protein
VSLLLCHAFDTPTHRSWKDTLLIDTGSSNTWLGAGLAYVKTSTSKDTGGTVSVSYGSGSFSGEECMYRFFSFVRDSAKIRTHEQTPIRLPFRLPL